MSFLDLTIAQQTLIVATIGVFASLLPALVDYYVQVHKPKKEEEKQAKIDKKNEERKVIESYVDNYEFLGTELITQPLNMIV